MLNLNRCPIWKTWRKPRLPRRSHTPASKTRSQSASTHGNAGVPYWLPCLVFRKMTSIGLTHRKSRTEHFFQKHASDFYPPHKPGSVSTTPFREGSSLIGILHVLVKWNNLFATAPLLAMFNKPLTNHRRIGVPAENKNTADPGTRILSPLASKSPGLSMQAPAVNANRRKDPLPEHPARPQTTLRVRCSMPCHPPCFPILIFFW